MVRLLIAFLAFVVPFWASATSGAKSTEPILLSGKVGVFERSGGVDHSNVLRLYRFRAFEENDRRDKPAFWCSVELIYINLGCDAYGNGVLFDSSSRNSSDRNVECQVSRLDANTFSASIREDMFTDGTVSHEIIFKANQYYQTEIFSYAGTWNKLHVLTQEPLQIQLVPWQADEKGGNRAMITPKCPLDIPTTPSR